MGEPEHYMRLMEQEKEPIEDPLCDFNRYLEDSFSAISALNHSHEVSVDGLLITPVLHQRSDGGRQGAQVSGKYIGR